MGLKKNLLYIIGIFVFGAFHATAALVPDSIGAKMAEGRKMIIHKIEPRETWYSVSRKYGVSVQSIQGANQGITSLQIGESILVPAEKRKIKSSTVINTPVPIDEPITERHESKPTQTIPAANSTNYEVQQGETMYSISKKFNVKVADIMRWNGLSSQSLSLGQVIIVSGAPASISKTTPPRRDKNGKVILDPWERMEKRATSVTVEKGKIDTTRKGITITQQGKPIQGPGVPAVKPKIVPPANTSPVPTAIKPNMAGGGSQMPPVKPDGVAVNPNEPVSPTVKDTSAVRATTQVAPKVPEKVSNVKPTGDIEPAGIPPSVAMKTAAKAEEANKPLKEVIEKGAASWINDEQVNPNKFYALHRTAPIGTIIKVTNTMNNQSVFVKVVGILPETGDNQNLIIKISKAAAKKLQVLDNKFQADLSYGMP
jgi:peptidoglycan DL-endopeptidase LytF